MKRVVVDAREAVGAIGVGPDPLGEARLDLDQLFLGRFGRLDVENAALAAIDDLDVEDLRGRAVESVVQKLAGMPARCAPFGRAGGIADERAAVDRPGGDLLGVQDLDFAAHHVARKHLDHVGRNPRRAEAGSDVRRVARPSAGSPAEPATLRSNCRSRVAAASAAASLVRTAPER